MLFLSMTTPNTHFYSSLSSCAYYLILFNPQNYFLVLTNFWHQSILFCLIRIPPACISIFFCSQGRQTIAGLTISNTKLLHKPQDHLFLKQEMLYIKSLKISFSEMLVSSQFILVLSGVS